MEPSQSQSTQVIPGITLGKIAEAMSKAQAEIKVAVFDKQANYGPYASFKSVREASIDALSKNGIAVFQPVNFDGKDYFLETLLVHSSGEKITSHIKLLVDKNNMQGLGSAITYAKRYAWSAIAGIVSDDDDDGAEASKTTLPKDPPPQKPPPKNYAPQSATSPQSPPSSPHKGDPLKDPPKIPKPKAEGPSEAQLKRLYGIGKTMGWNPRAIRIYSLAHVNRTPGKLSNTQYDQLCSFLEGSPFDHEQESEVVSLERGLTPEQLAQLE